MVKKLPGVPNWMYESASKEKKDLMKSYANKYLKGLPNNGELLKHATGKISGFIDLLAKYDDDAVI